MCVRASVCVLISPGPQQRGHQRKRGLSFLCLSHCHKIHEPCVQQLHPTYRGEREGRGWGGVYCVCVLI